MPAKVNPVLPEVVNQVCFKVIGNDTCITMAAEAGQLQLNVMEPVIGQAMFESMHILTNVCFNLGLPLLWWLNRQFCIFTLLILLAGTWTSIWMSNVFTFKGITFMSCLKKYAYTPFILLLHGVAASTSPNMMYDTDKKDYSLSPEVTPKLSWEKSESQVDKTQYCLTPSDPGCSNMWQKEKEKENDERIQHHQQKKFYNSLK